MTYRWREEVDAYVERVSAIYDRRARRDWTPFWRGFRRGYIQGSLIGIALVAIWLMLTLLTGDRHLTAAALDAHREDR